jgi:hypothetical protein
LLAGDRIALLGGEATIKFESGAVTVLQGPCIFDVVAPREGNLRRGWLKADVPPKAVGFLVDTPTARIVDLGTSFEVNVNRDGVASVSVVEGKVVAHKLDAAGNPFGESVALGVGQFARFDETARPVGGASRLNPTLAMPQSERKLQELERRLVDLEGELIEVRQARARQRQAGEPPPAGMRSPVEVMREMADLQSELAVMKEQNAN